VYFRHIERVTPGVLLGYCNKFQPCSGLFKQAGGSLYIHNIYYSLEWHMTHISVIKEKS